MTRQFWPVSANSRVKSDHRRPDLSSTKVEVFLDKRVREMRQTAGANSRRGASKKREISRILLSINLHFSVDCTSSKRSAINHHKWAEFYREFVFNPEMGGNSSWHQLKNNFPFLDADARMQSPLQYAFADLEDSPWKRCQCEENILRKKSSGWVYRTTRLRQF